MTTLPAPRCVGQSLSRSVPGWQPRRKIEELERRGVPIVFLDADYPGDRMIHVSINYSSGIQQAVEHLVSLGHRDIGFISGPLALHSSQSRRQGYLDGMREHGLEPDHRLFQEGTHTADGGQRAMTALLQASAPPTAVVASNDWTAIGALHAIVGARLRVPEDVSLVGFDDTPLARYTNPALTSVRMSAADLGTRAFEALFRLLAGAPSGEDRYRVDTQLIVRQSTARPRDLPRA